MGFVNNLDFLNNMLRNLPSQVFIVDPETHQIQYINKLQPGYKLEDIIGMDMFNMVAPEHVEIYKQKIKEIKETRTPSFYEVVGESTLYPEGKAWYRTQISVIDGPENSIAGLMFIPEDITVSKLQEFENSNKSEKIKAIINNTNDMICSIDLDYNLMEFNNVLANLVKLGFGVEMEAGMPVLRFTDPKQHDRLKEIYKKVISGETLTDVQLFNTERGHVVYNETSYNPIYDVNKKVVGINIFSKDITERVKNEQKIQSSLKEKEVLLAEIHHRIKNNLAMISSLLQLQEMNIDNAEVKEALVLSQKRIKSTALIHELLYKSESFQNIDLKEYLSELFKHLKMNDKIQLDLNGDVLSLDLTKAMPLGLLLNEIMLNSFKHSYTDESKGRIEISLKSDDNTITIDYKDFEGNFPNSIDFNKSTTTGLTLINTFIDQLEGSIDMICKSPPQYKIQIPLNEN